MVSAWSYRRRSVRGVPQFGGTFFCSALFCYGLTSDSEVSTAKRERKSIKIHAISASRQVTAFPLLGIVKNSNFAGVPRVHDFSPEAIWVFHVYIRAWKAYSGLQNNWYNTENKSRKSGVHPLWKTACVTRVDFPDKMTVYLPMLSRKYTQHK